MTDREKKGIWQYMIDHSRKCPGGYWRIQIFVWDEENFWRRVKYRIDGAYKRYEVESREAMNKEAYAMRLALRINNERSAKMSKIIARIKKEGSIKEKLLLRLYRYCRTHLFTS